MKRRIDASNGSKSDSDRAKRVYRAALESIKCLEAINTGQKAYREVFRQDAVGLRNKLKNYCERLMFYNPVEYGRKAEEVLWRKVFYDVIQVVKKNKNHMRRHGSVETAYRTHLAAAIGYYQHLVFRLQREFSLKLTGVIDYYLLQEMRSGRRADSAIKQMNPAVQEWAQRACHRCLICLGDVLRYICDVDHSSTPIAAERYYHQAFILFPEIGMPHNQLGTLAGSKYCGCEAAYHYIRCLASEKPFEGAKGNLNRLFEKNTKRYYDLNEQQARDLPPEDQRCKDIKRFFTRFLKLLDIFHGSNNNMELSELQSLCQFTLQDFNLCMFYEPPHQFIPNLHIDGLDSRDDCTADSGAPMSFLYLDNNIVFKIVCCLICTIHLLEKNGQSNLTAATAFLLALFSHILNHVVMRLQSRLEDLEHPNKILLAGSSLPSENLNVNDSSGSDGEVSKINLPELIGNISPQYTPNGTKKSRPTRLKNIRRRRRRRQLSDSDSDAISDMSDISDLSEGKAEQDDQVISSDSADDDDDDDLASYFDRGSDSDLSEEECSQSYPQKESHGENKWPPQTQSLPNGDLQHIWSNVVDNPGLAHMSSELFSSSLMFLGQDLASSTHTQQDMSQSHPGSDVPVPPGFNCSVEAKHVEELKKKLDNFQIETDNETNYHLTDTEQSSNMTETDDADNEQSSSSNTEKQDMEGHKLQQALNIVQSEGLLTTVKVVCDWMRGQVPIISVCAQSSHTLWQRLSVLLNFLPHENELSNHDVCWLQELHQITTQTRVSDWAQGFPLTEDIEMCQLPSLHDVHSNIDFTTRHRAQLTNMQETFLRICCIRRFGYFLSSIDSIDFTYKPETAMFVGPAVEFTNLGNTKDNIDKTKDAETRRNQLMRDMAQLRLQAEVKELEGSLNTNDTNSAFPPYVLVDHAALCEHLATVKELAASARCIVVIPLAVVDSLDMKKKESPLARDVIRWLELQLRRGNRYIRAQKTQESLMSDQYGHLKKKNRNSWYILEMLGCARYLAQQTGNFTGHSKVVVMTGEVKLLTQLQLPLIQQVKASAHQEGVSIETVSEFCLRWKSFLCQVPVKEMGDG